MLRLSVFANSHVVLDFFVTCRNRSHSPVAALAFCMSVHTANPNPPSPWHFSSCLLHYRRGRAPRVGIVSSISNWCARCSINKPPYGRRTTRRRGAAHHPPARHVLKLAALCVRFQHSLVHGIELSHHARYELPYMLHLIVEQPSILAQRGD
jgi:hypothetical protein